MKKEDRRNRRNRIKTLIPKSITKELIDQKKIGRHIQIPPGHNNEHMVEEDQ